MGNSSAHIVADVIVKYMYVIRVHFMLKSTITLQKKVSHHKDGLQESNGNLQSYMFYVCPWHLHNFILSYTLAMPLYMEGSPSPVAFELITYITPGLYGELNI